MRRLGAALLRADHRTIAWVYGAAAASFLAVGFLLIALLRYQLAYPEAPMVGLEALFGPELAEGGRVSPVLYNQLGAMHGTIMVFLAVVPLLVGGFGGFLVPLQIGAPGMAFPRLHRLSCHLFLAAGGVMLASFFAPGGAAQSGWTSYPPLAGLAPAGQSYWLVGLFLLGLSSVLGAVVMITTILQRRTAGLGFRRLPFFVWSQLVTAFLLLLAFPPLMSAAVYQWCDRQLGSSLFMPSGLVVSGEVMSGAGGDWAGGGSPILWQHLFWFLAHPEVYVLILPALGIVAEVLTSGFRRPLWGYRAAVGSVLFLGFMSFLVWAHHMFLAGMGTELSAFFQVTTAIVSVPSVIVGTCLLLTLWGGRLEVRTSVLFALAFLPMFAIGGATGLPLGLAAADIHLHDTYYVVGHFHYVVAPGTLFAIFAALYHWWPKLTGRALDERWGRWHFWPSLILMNAIFLPMLFQGLAGVHRRLWDGGRTYAYAADVMGLHGWISWAAWLLALAQVPLLLNLWRSRRRGPATPNPWRATTLEWRMAETAPKAWIEKGPYLYGSDETFANDPDRVRLDTADREPTGLTEAQVAHSLGAASAVMFFGGLWAAWVLLRAAQHEWPSAAELGADPAPAILATVLLALGALVSAWPRIGTRRFLPLLSMPAGALMLTLARDVFPRVGEHNGAACFVVITGALAVLVLLQAGAVFRSPGKGESGPPGDVGAKVWSFLALVLSLIWLLSFFA